ncbi:MAG: uracil-DNA glycosylase family protein [Xanthomonadales bacterium]|nr:uracil-DNA glycosylase family protein [Xanthomonadales bacterium]
MSAALQQLHIEIQACRLCAEHLPLGPRPVVRPSAIAPILLIGQAPGTRVHASGVPWDDASGERLRDWLGVDRERFYDPRCFAIMPMGFCYPGRGRSGDLPPRPECAPRWHAALLQQMPGVRLRLLIGRYAIAGYGGGLAGDTLADQVRGQSMQSDRLALPHPSPRNRLWLSRNPWFDRDTLPVLRTRIAALLNSI